MLENRKRKLSETPLTERERERAQVRKNGRRMVKLRDHFDPPKHIDAQKIETHKD